MAARHKSSPTGLFRLSPRAQFMTREVDARHRKGDQSCHFARSFSSSNAQISVARGTGTILNDDKR